MACALHPKVEVTMKRTPAPTALLALASLVTGTLTAWPVTAGAQEATALAPAEAEKTVSVVRDPSVTMLESGIAMLECSYVPALVVGLTSGLPADRTLLAPIAGPWLDFTRRPGCGPRSPCDVENTNKVLLATDGVFQALGAISVLGGLLVSGEPETPVQRAHAGPAVRFSPAKVGGSGYGLLASSVF